MKTLLTCSLNRVVAAACLMMSIANGSTLYWDGTNATVNGISSSTSATTWSTAAGNWDNGTSEVLWTNGNDTAVFGGTASTVTVGAGGVQVGGLRFHTTGYTIAAGTNGLTFSSGTNRIDMLMSTGATTANITGNVGGSGSSLILSSHPLSNSTLTFSGTSATGWTGSTIINTNVLLTTTSASGAVNQVLNSTSGITLNGGGIRFNRFGTTNINAISDSAAITVNGGGTFAVNSADAGGAGAIENIGTVTVNSGQMDFNNVNNASSGMELVMAGLTRNGTSALTFSGTLGTSRFKVTGAGTTSAGEIIGPWATTGGNNGIGAQSDYAIYSGDYVAAANISASAQSTWSTTHAATSNYTLNTSNVTAVDNGRLTAGRYINSLRSTTGATAPSVVDATTDYITMAGNNFQNGDVVVSRNTTGGQLTPGRAYYVINAGGAGAGTFQVSTTPGGSAVDLTTTATGFISGGLSLNGNILGTYGILNGSSDPFAIGRAGGGSVTLATNTSGNLYVTNGNASVWIDAPITDNGVGVLTLVKGGTSGNGSGNVTLSGANTYSGGTVVNSGALNFFTSNSWVSGQNITFGGSGTISASVGALTGGTLTSSEGAVGVINGSSSITFTSTTGAGTIVYQGGGSAILNLGNASGFTGNLQISQASGTNPRPTVVFSSLGDGGALQFGGGQGDSNQKVTFQFNGSSALTWNTRQVQILPRSASNNVAKSMVLDNNSASAISTLTINTSLLNSSDRTGQGFVLGGSNTGNNTFAGVIGNSTVNGAALNVNKNGAGKWILSGNNTFTGRLVVGQGTLSVATFNESNVAGALGMSVAAIQLGGDERAQNNATELILSGNNSGTLEYTGGAVSSTRQFFIGDTSAASTGGGTIANNGSGAMTFTATSLNSTIASITATRTLTLGGSQVGNNVIQGTIQDNAATGKINLIKSGAGKWVLAGTNTYTGTTTVSNGTLLVNGSLASGSAVSVNAGILGGTGDIGGTVAVASGATLAPGASIESLGAGALTMSSGSIFAYEIANSSSTGADLLAVNGALSLTNVTLSLDSASMLALASGSWSVNDKITLMSYINGGSGITSGLNGYTDDSNYNFGSNVWKLNYNDTIAGGNFGSDAIANGQNYFVTLTAVTIIPEPGVALLGGLGALMLLMRRRRA